MASIVESLSLGVVLGVIVFVVLVVSGCAGVSMLPLETGGEVVVYTTSPYYVISPMFDYSLPSVERVYIYSNEVIVNRLPNPPIIIDKHPNHWVRVENDKDTRERIVEGSKAAPRRDVMKRNVTNKEDKEDSNSKKRRSTEERRSR
jgi:hypothetical protein